MTTIRVSETTTVGPEAFLASLTDFGPGREEVWTNSQAAFLQVHGRGDTWADVTEGSSAGGGVWERLRYDWSRPGVVTATTTDSNAWGRASGHTFTLTPRPGGGTTVDVVVVREGTTLKGRVLGAVLAVAGTGFVRKSLRTTIEALERRSR